MPIAPAQNLHWPAAREIAAALKGNKTGEGRYMARCPWHDDRVPSLGIVEGVDKRGNKRPYVTCFSGCHWRDVQAELARRGLWPKYERGRP
jgi:hypothetical protein